MTTLGWVCICNRSAEIASKIETGQPRVEPGNDGSQLADARAKLWGGGSSHDDASEMALPQLAAHPVGG
jgi:hypothetical protein